MTQLMTAIVLALSLLCATAGAETTDRDDSGKVNEAFRNAIKDQDWEAANSLIIEHQRDRKAHPQLKERWSRQNWKVELHVAQMKAEGKLPAKGPSTVLKSYSVGHLPIYNQQELNEGMRIDISLLFAYLLAKVGEENWNNGGTSLQPYEQNLTLLISTTPEVHDKIQAALDELSDEVKVTGRAVNWNTEPTGLKRRT
ncbi:MAG: hypothetical protein WDZ51_01090 [Pirellulaceae bacterium]